jgi:hypothetical protein
MKRQYITVNGTLIKMFVMEEVSKFGQTGPNIPVIGKMIKPKEKGNYFMQMEIYMKGIG